MKDVGIVVATYGEEAWMERGTTLAEDTAMQFPEAKVVPYHHWDSLAKARNTGADMLDTKWLIFLDADDHLGFDYVHHMIQGTEMLRQPATQGIYSDGSHDDMPHVIEAGHLLDRNHMVIGTMCNHDLFDQVGQFDPDLPALEDWDLWIRMWLKGANWEAIPEAVYWVGVNDDGRNSNRRAHNTAFQTIRKRYKGRSR